MGYCQRAAAAKFAMVANSAGYMELHWYFDCWILLSEYVCK